MKLKDLRKLLRLYDENLEIEIAISQGDDLSRDQMFVVQDIKLQETSGNCLLLTFEMAVEALEKIATFDDPLFLEDARIMRGKAQLALKLIKGDGE